MEILLPTDWYDKHLNVEDDEYDVRAIPTLMLEGRIKKAPE